MEKKTKTYLYNIIGSEMIIIIILEVIILIPLLFWLNSINKYTIYENICVIDERFNEYCRNDCYFNDNSEDCYDYCSKINIKDCYEQNVNIMEFCGEGKFSNRKGKCVVVDNSTCDNNYCGGIYIDSIIKDQIHLTEKWLDNNCINIDSDYKCGDKFRIILSKNLR